ncbi:MAG: hypothetical protein H7062_06185 [Candidatus Saccharimonas sp.]|nr:hypothetical protein [Planctomycetaceae bacterium]
MNEPKMSHESPGDTDSTKPARHSRSGRASVICSSLGCLGWIGLVPILTPFGGGEQLSRFFAVLFNAILIGVVGGPATILLFVGRVLSRRATRQGDSKLGHVGRIASKVGLVIGGLVLLMNLPSILMTLH